ncbi:neutral zinc metallopeptidase [Nonomuraea sp. NPDC050556]|uniref:neutral zinc metallopeptidase n=1 Tax=Nonomuraea sp. NPDC050556 TaxID=3364369 RepID=UPI00378BDAD4
MRTPLMTLLCGVLASLLFAGTASAAATPSPGFKPVLTKNPLYKTGKFDLEECHEQPVQSDDLDGARIYLEFVMECLDKSWTDQLAKVNIKYAKPKFQVISKPGAPTGCGTFPLGAQALYCPNNKKITFLLDAGILSEPTELFLMEVIAHEYGHHIQQLTGMLPEVDKYKGKSKARIFEEARRVELQAECLSGAFIGSIWHSLGRRDFDWKYIVKVAQAGFDDGIHGKPSNIAKWLQRGFDAESPNACNTWSAKKSTVS